MELGDALSGFPEFASYSHWISMATIGGNGRINGQNNPASTPGIQIYSIVSEHVLDVYPPPPSDSS